MSSGNVKTPLLFRCKIKYNAEQARQPVIEKLLIKAYRELAFLLQKFPTGNLQKRRNFDRTILWNGEGNFPAAGVQRAASPLCRSRAAAIAQRSVACDTPYWVLSDAENGRAAADSAAKLPFSKATLIEKRRENDSVKLTRHNGRAGKNGIYNPKHNDRRFDVANSEHIDTERAKQNIYWDCYTGYSSALTRGQDKENDYSFERIEQLYYFEHYADHIQAQNERNEKTRHTERNRTVEDLLTNNKTCPEESIYQIGTVEESVSGDVLAKIAADFFAEMEEKYGSHVHILNWALHLDEGTPHIHERHVFDCENRYGELCPQQEKALEELCIPLPNPDKKKGRNNNRKQTFDAECRKMLFRVCEKHNLHLQIDPTYGGRGYLEKQDFIIEKQKDTISVQKDILSENEQTIEEQAKKIQKAENTLSQRVKVIEKQDKIIAEKNAAIMEKHSVLEDVTMKLAEVETLVDEVAEQAYEKACDAVANTVRQETQKEDIKILDDYSRWLSAPERTADKKLRDYAVKRLGALKEKLIKSAKATVQKVTDSLQEPEHRQKNLEQVREKARESIKDRLARGKTEADRLNRERMERISPTAKKDMEL